MRHFFITGLLVVAAAVGLQMWASSESTEDDSRYLVGRLWLERLPTSERDMVHLLALTEDGQDRVGTVAKASAWRVQAENFRFMLQDKQLKMDFPQEHKRLKLQVRSFSCDAPEPFTLCLELRAEENSEAEADVFRFYSREDWSFAEESLEQMALPFTVGSLIDAQLQRAQTATAGRDHAWNDHGDVAMTPSILGRPNTVRASRKGR